MFGLFLPITYSFLTPSPFCYTSSLYPQHFHSPLASSSNVFYQGSVPITHSISFPSYMISGLILNPSCSPQGLFFRLFRLSGLFLWDISTSISTFNPVLGFSFFNPHFESYAFFFPTLISTAKMLLIQINLQSCSQRTFLLYSQVLIILARYFSIPFRISTFLPKLFSFPTDPQFCLSRSFLIAFAILFSPFILPSLWP